MNGDKINKENGVKIILKNTSSILLTGLATYYPQLAGLFSVGSALIQTWGDFGQTRVNELVKFVSEHKDEFVEEIVISDKFKTLFLNILERHMKEASERKRELLRNYLLSVGRGYCPDFDDFTKMNNTLDNITFDEIDLLSLWGENGVISNYFNSLPGPIPSVTFGTIQSAVFSAQPRNPYLMKIVSNENKFKGNQILQSLGHKGLLYVAFADNFGSGHEAKVKEITDFGRAFLTFIKG